MYIIINNMIDSVQNDDLVIKDDLVNKDDVVKKAIAVIQIDLTELKRRYNVLVRNTTRSSNIVATIPGLNTIRALGNIYTNAYYRTYLSKNKINPNKVLLYPAEEVGENENLDRSGGGKTKNKKQKTKNKKQKTKNKKQKTKNKKQKTKNKKYY